MAVGLFDATMIGLGSWSVRVCSSALQGRVVGPAVVLAIALAALVAAWHDSAMRWRAEHVCSARVFQTSTCSAMASASSTSMPR